ncbi:FAD-dependent oxidoreductase [Bacillus sp. SCS-151]|uniref:FAD-dependent oxidoreductase n=1 Tax=Nanhaiella sioensis TaxID=3115293 RepID=UPI00397CABC3
MTYNDENTKLPKSSKSLWMNFNDMEDFPTLDEHTEVDVVIVGGGITGITSAYLLVNEGFKVAILEADKLFTGTTGHTTAKITAQHSLIYDKFIHSMDIGMNKAKLYYEKNKDALAFIKETVEENKIDCDFCEQDSYIYATTEEYRRKLEKEALAYEKIGIEGGLVDNIPFNITIKNGLVMKNQAQFHPVKYLTHLVQVIIEKGGLIFENTTAVNIKTGDKPSVLTREGASITGNYILSCSHFPFYEGAGLYSTRLHAERSYIIAVKAKDAYPGGMYISADQPIRSLRSATIAGEEMILIGGEGHKTGEGKSTLAHFNALEKFGNDVFDIESIAYRWSAQDLYTLDNIPYIGAVTLSQPNIMIATGYRKWGMTNGTVAALLFKDILLKKIRVDEHMFGPSRFHLNPSLKNFLVDNANVAGHLIKGKLEILSKDASDLSTGEGAVITVDGHRKGAYKDDTGKLHIIDTTCTHIGCEVEWNDGERSWDCPCHGSRFSYTGEVIEGPAEKPLQKYDYKMIDNLTSEDSGY